MKMMMMHSIHLLDWLLCLERDCISTLKLDHGTTFICIYLHLHLHLHIILNILIYYRNCARWRKVPLSLSINNNLCTHFGPMVLIFKQCMNQIRISFYLSELSERNIYSFQLMEGKIYFHLAFLPSKLVIFCCYLCCNYEKNTYEHRFEDLSFSLFFVDVFFASFFHDVLWEWTTKPKTTKPIMSIY